VDTKLQKFEINQENGAEIERKVKSERRIGT